MLTPSEQNVLVDLVAKSNLQKHNIFERENEFIWDTILKTFNSLTEKNLSVEELREEWTEVYETVGYQTNVYSSIEDDETININSVSQNDNLGG